jgi:hypothetical protein
MIPYEYMGFEKLQGLRIGLGVMNYAKVSLGYKNY